MFLNISLKSILKSKWLWLGISLVLVIISIAIWKKADKIILGEKINKVKFSPFELETYYAEYDMTIVSNKNVNTYFVKEWYSMKCHRFEYLDKMNNVIQVIITEDKIYINNINEKNSLNLNNLNYGKNITSFSTLISMYNCVKNSESVCNCEFTQYEKEGNIYAYIELCKGKICECNVCIGISENKYSNITVEIDGRTNLPLGFTVYDKDKNVISSIVYTKFEINVEIKESLFTIS